MRSAECGAEYAPPNWGSRDPSRRMNITPVWVEQAQGRGGLGLTVPYCLAGTRGSSMTARSRREMTRRQIPTMSSAWFSGAPFNRGRRKSLPALLRAFCRLTLHLRRPLGYSVCRMHGAGGGAPKGNRNALKHGEFAAETLRPEARNSGRRSNGPQDNGGDRIAIAVTSRAWFAPLFASVRCAGLALGRPLWLEHREWFRPFLARAPGPVQHKDVMLPHWHRYASGKPVGGRSQEAAGGDLVQRACGGGRRDVPQSGVRARPRGHFSKRRSALHARRPRRPGQEQMP